jgi:hypothetical protein
LAFTFAVGSRLAFGAFAFGSFFASVLFFMVFSVLCFVICPIMNLATVEQ